MTLLEPIAKALDISIIELFAGRSVSNGNRTSNMLRSVFYVCPMCGNGIFSYGQAVVSCCGITLVPQESEEMDEEHPIEVEMSDGEYYVTVNHPMEKDHYITMISAVSDASIQLTQLYPEGNAEARFRRDRIRWIYAYCNRHGLYRIDLRRMKR